MKNPLDIAELLAAGFTWRTSVKAARHLGSAFYRRCFLAVAVIGWSVWAMAAWVAVAQAEERADLAEAHRDVERKRGDYYEREIIGCLNWGAMQIYAVVFDCKMKEIKR